MTSTQFPPGFFDRADNGPDAVFYGPTRLVTHIDENAIAELERFHGELGSSGAVLDLMSSWISHLPQQPDSLTVLGMNRPELDANPMATQRVVHDLNAEPTLPFADAAFDVAICSVSVDYLTRPVEVFAEVARVLGPGGRFACTFSNRCFPTKAIRGWLRSNDAEHCAIVARYFEASATFGPVEVEVLVAPGQGTDPLYAVWAATLS